MGNYVTLFSEIKFSIASYICNNFYLSDTDECSDYPCDANGACTNIPGSYNCQCNDGFSGDGWACSGTILQNMIPQDRISIELKILRLH